MERQSDRPAAGLFGDRREVWILAGVFAVALAVRLAYLADSADNPTFARPVVDAQTYHELARDLAVKRYLGDGFFWQPFYYPLFLATVYSVSGASILAAKVVQALLGGGTCVLTYLLARRVLGRAGGLIAAGIVAFYGPLLFFEAELLAAGWAAFWAVLLVWLLVAAGEAPTPRRCVALGLVAGLSVLTRPVFVPPLLAGAAWLAARLWRPGGRRAAFGAIARAAAGFAVVTVPVALLAWRQTGRLSFLPCSGGINLYIGNNPEVCRTLTIRPGWRWRQLTEEPLARGCRTQAEQQRFFLGRVGEYAASQPGAFAAGLARKALEFVNSREIPRNVDPCLFRRWSGLLRAGMWKAGRFGFPFGLLLPLAAAGVVLAWGRLPKVLLWFVALYAGAVVGVFVAGRYRVPIVPLLAVPAAGAIVGAVEAVRHRRWRRLAAALAVGGAAAVVSILPPAFCEEKGGFEAELHLYLGSYHKLEPGPTGKFAAHLRKAIELAPRYSDAYGELGELCLKDGRVDEAIGHLARAVAIEPGNFLAHHNLGAAKARQSKVGEALRHYFTAVEHGPGSAETHLNLAKLLDHEGRWAEAVAHYRQAAELKGEDAQAAVRLVHLLTELGRDREAAEHCRRLLARDADFLPAQVKLAWVLATSADETLRNGPEAVRLAKPAAMAVGSADALDVLAAALAEAGRFDEAVEAAERARAKARSAGRTERAREMADRAALYRARRPYRRAGPAPKE